MLSARSVPQMPFAAKSMAELKKKVKQGKVNVAVSEVYSAELRSLATSMLTVDVADRPSIAEVLAMPCITRRWSMVPGADHRDKACLASTIKVPSNLRKLQQELPGVPTAREPRSHSHIVGQLSWPCACALGCLGQCRVRWWLRTAHGMCFALHVPLEVPQLRVTPWQVQLSRRDGLPVLLWFLPRVSHRSPVL